MGGGVAPRLHLIPRYRQRLEDPAFGMANPVWVDDDAFDLHWHLRRATVSGFVDLQGYVAREMSRRIDRSRARYPSGYAVMLITSLPASWNSAPPRASRTAAPV